MYLIYVCTISEANIGIQIASISKSMMLNMGIAPQVGMNFDQMIDSYTGDHYTGREMNADLNILSSLR